MAKRVGKQTVSLSYKDGLTNEERQRYEAKLMIIGGCDPYEGKLPWVQNVDIFPSVTYPDIVNYLLFTPSPYSADDLKAYKSLEAYNQFVCGWVRDTAGLVQGDHLVVTAKVMHSQRMREKPLRPWIIAKKDGKIVAAHCNCMAGLGEACSHIASVLFYLEAAVKIRDSKTVTEEKAYWLLPSACKSIEYKEVRDINFMSAKTAKKQLDNRIEAARSATPVTPITPGTSSTRKRTVPVATNEDFLLFCAEINKLTSKPALLSIVEPYAEKYIPKPDLKEFPMIMTELRDEKCDGMNYKELTDTCANIAVICSEQQAYNVEEETRGQARSKMWHRFRAGRITASKAKAVSSTNKASPSQSLIKEICYPGEKHFQTNATKWGCDHEKEALHKFMEEIGPLHENSRLQNSGFVISQDIPYIGASPDGLFICDCCGPACVEVKCPYNARYEEVNENTVDCLQRKDGELELKQEHQYHFQVQTQLGVSKHEVGYFVVWTANDLHIEAIMFDSELWDNICASAKDIMYAAVLPEIVGKFYTRLPTVKSLPVGILKSVENTTACQNIQPLKKSAEKQDNTEELYCYCSQVEHGKMIGCDNEACEIEWFHYRCVNVENAPTGKWYCPDCRKLPCYKRKRLN